MVNLKQKAEDNAKLNENLKALPEGAQIEKLAGLIAKEKAIALQLSAEKIDWLDLWEKRYREHVDIISASEGSIKALLHSVEEQSGFSKMPTSQGTYCLAQIPEAYEVKDQEAVPEEFIVTKEVKSVDKKLLNHAIKEGVIDPIQSSNWLSTRPAYKILKLM